ncbi:hypothetical protein LTR49_027925 [Elasticomyces elasticus]|nr:hypothetical protein LTR49_027925 [Elasticomyces elasticus]
MSEAAGHRWYFHSEFWTDAALRSVSGAERGAGRRAAVKGCHGTIWHDGQIDAISVVIGICETSCGYEARCKVEACNIKTKGVVISQCIKTSGGAEVSELFHILCDGVVNAIWAISFCLYIEEPALFRFRARSLQAQSPNGCLNDAIIHDVRPCVRRFAKCLDLA